MIDVVPDKVEAEDTATFCVMETALVAVQPLLLVMVAVYSPGKVTVKSAITLTLLLPSLHA